ncbi:aquaporin-1 [Danio aesculapii]|uniref:aquaporin-1 n=1 Tax=Danio aesculapii TaxID=1142201 RepID=UPI0024BFED1B|nr:aquaporin-1 [Danio aesculapii]
MTHSFTLTGERQPGRQGVKMDTSSEEYMRAFSIKGLNQVRPSSLVPQAVLRKDQASKQKKAGLILTDILSGLFLRDVFCEFLGTIFFLFISLSSAMLWPHAGSLSVVSIPDEPLPTLDSSLVSTPDPLHVSLAFGVSVALACVCLGEVHLNPVITLALVAGLKVSPWRGVLLVGVQLLAALSACALLLVVAPTTLSSNLGINEVAPGVYLYQALLVEMAATFQLVLCVQAATHPKSAFSSNAPAVIGLSVTLGHLMAIGFTGCGMNPARSFGPAVLTMNFHNHWVYWVGPCSGSLLAWFLHDLLLRPRWSCFGDWVTECKETLLKDLSIKPSDPEPNMEA